ncbi:hypothetical protein M8J76_015898 [Diaphorina citri]|nr:hypothetical protein M8J76_015898 [Diaphorina citri]
MESKIQSTKSFLSSKSIEIESTNCWFRNCVQWFVEENNSGSLNDLHNFVYDQFILADLRDVQLNCLPANILEQEKLMLNGKFTLQIDSMQDVSQSCYSQIQIIRGTGKNLDVENQDARSRNHSEMDQSNRRSHMFKLDMTDGAQHVFGMEYETLNEIRKGFIPGCPLEVRRGVFFLKAKNFLLLGGELDSIIVSNSIENILARKLNLEENPNSGHTNIVNELTSGTQHQPTQNATSRPVLNPPNHMNAPNSNSYQNSNIVNTENSNSYQNRSSVNTANSYQNSSSNQNHLPSSLSNQNRVTNQPDVRRSVNNESDDWDDEMLDMEVWNNIESSLVNLPSNPPTTASTGRNNPPNPSHTSNATNSNPLINPNTRPPPSSSTHVKNPTTSASNHTSNPKRYPSPDLTPPAKRLNSASTEYQSNQMTPICPPSLATPPSILAPPSSSSTPLAPPTSSSTPLAPPLTSSPPTRMTFRRIKESPPPFPFCMVFKSCKVVSVEKLSVGKGAWKLPAQIKDGSLECLNVVFNDVVIFGISGVSAAELYSKRSQVVSDPELRRSMEKIVEKVRTQIMNYEGPMKILFAENQKPTVVSLPK